MNRRQEAFIRYSIRSILTDLAQGMMPMATAERLIIESIEYAQKEIEA